MKRQHGGSGDVVKTGRAEAVAIVVSANSTDIVSTTIDGVKGVFFLLINKDAVCVMLSWRLIPTVNVFDVHLVSCVLMSLWQKRSRKDIFRGNVGKLHMMHCSNKRLSAESSDTGTT